MPASPVLLGTGTAPMTLSGSRMRASLVTLGDPDQVTGGYLYHLRMAEAAPAHAAEIRFVSVPQRGFLLSLAGGRRAARAARTEATDVTVVDSIAAAFVGPWLARTARTPAVGVLHQPPGGIDADGPLRTVQASLDRLAWHRVTLLIVAGRHLADQLQAEGIPDHRIRIVPPGRDVASPPPEPARDLRRGRQAAFLCVGNWLPRKGILETLDALATLPEDAATLHLVGGQETGGPYARDVRDRLDRPDVRSRVVVHGAVPRDRVAALYAGADAFVLPATREPYGTVWAEAMAFGLPVVGWHAANLPYLAEDGREGFLVPPGDVPALGRALARLADDAALRAQMGAAAARRAQTFPTWTRAAEMFFDVLHEVARTHQP